MFSGGAIGASSVLLIIPNDNDPGDSNSAIDQNSNLVVEADSTLSIERNSKSSNPRGIVVAIIVNMQEVGLTKTAMQIANNFKEI